MFETLNTGLKRAFKTIAGKGKLTEANMREGLEIVRDALIEADVNFEVVKTFLAKVSEQALGEKVLTHLNPSEQLFNIVYKEMVELMGPVDPSINMRGDLTVLMLCGLQGAGKTTTCGKLASMLKDHKARPMMAAADLQRPAAIEQLRVLGEQLNIPVYTEPGSNDAVGVCQRAIEKAKQSDCNLLIIDTAGRLHVDDDLMQELKQIDNRVGKLLSPIPHQVYLVVDSNMGQDAVNSAKAFNEALELDGVILTKLDGDSRGGAALSVKEVTGVPIKFIGTGEHMMDLEPFNPEGLASRVLGQGDIMSLITKAQRVIDEDEQQELKAKMEKGQFTLDDFKNQMGMMKKLGPMNKIMGLIPGMGDMSEMMNGMDTEKDMKRLNGMIDSMTTEERTHPNPSKFIDQSRRRRIAAGSGVQPHEINKLVTEFETMSQLMKQFSGGGKGGMMNAMNMLKDIPNMMSGKTAGPSTKQSTGTRKTAAQRKKDQEARKREKRKQKREKRNK